MENIFNLCNFIGSNNIVQISIEYVGTYIFIQKRISFNLSDLMRFFNSYTSLKYKPQFITSYRLQFIFHTFLFLLFFDE